MTNVNQKTKEYFWASVAILFLNAGLIILHTGGFLPLNFLAFALLVFFVFYFSFRNPQALFWTFISTLPLETIIISPDSLPFSLRPFQLLGAALIFSTPIIWLFRRLNKEKKESENETRNNNQKEKTGAPAQDSRAGCKFNFFELSLLLLALISLVTFALNSERASLTQTLSLVLLVGFFWISKSYLKTKREQLEALWFFLFGAFFVVVFSVYQALAFRLNLKSAQIFAGRVNGTFSEPDWLGIFLVFILSLILWSRLALKKSGRFRGVMIGGFPLDKTISWILAGYFFLAFWALFLTVARSAWLAFLAVFLVYFLLLLWMFFTKKSCGFQSGSFWKKIGDISGEILVLIISIFLAIFVSGVFELSTFHFANRAASSVSGKQLITISCEPESEIGLEISAMAELKSFGCRHINLEEISGEMAAGREVRKILRPDPSINIRKEIYAMFWQEARASVFPGQGLGSSGSVLGQDQNGNYFNFSNIFLESWFSFGVIGFLIFAYIFLFPFFRAASIIKKDFLRASFIALTMLGFLIFNLFNAGILLGFFWVWLVVGVSKQ